MGQREDLLGGGQEDILGAAERLTGVGRETY